MARSLLRERSHRIKNRFKLRYSARLNLHIRDIHKPNTPLYISEFRANRFLSAEKLLTASTAKSTEIQSTTKSNAKAQFDAFADRERRFKLESMRRTRWLSKSTFV
ncbi:ricin-containing lipase tectonin-like protein [Pseudozyma hubeiensis SY62]|uniref:Ricin-containing lipase tectonin-like protein n=1 Tax=Pseudozyma hubeiensis (strain SY62) TaxID=1305764 RepID=R9P9W0_PSEHS|nr:ricin-containing lipase tectonin-like protein [Pseudozyma hubeiensis SY62]GAC98144.1 ricin-containing lipase tectonin-like protein [Pseudozyma hubeiensis SY62]